MTGLDHIFERTKDFGLTYPKTARPGPVDGHRDPRGPPDRPARRVRHDRQRRRPHAAPVHQHDHRRQRRDRLADARDDARRASGSSAPRPPTSSPTSWPATRTRRSTRSGASGRSTTARPAGRPPTRRAPPATTATWPPTASSRRPRTRRRPALAVGVWMGNSDNTPNDGKLSLDTSAPLWSAILTEVSKGEPIAQFKPPRGTRDRRRSTPSPASSRARSRRKTIKELFLPGTVPTQQETLRRSRLDRRGVGPAVAGRLRRPEGHQGLLQPVRGRGELPGLAEGGRAWGARAARGPGRRRRTEGDPDLLLLHGAVQPVRADLGRAVRADASSCPLYTAAAAVLRPVPAAHRRTVARPAAGNARRPSRRSPQATPKPFPTPTSRQADARAEPTADAGRLRTRRSSRRRPLRRAGRAAPSGPAVAAPPRGPRRGARPCRGRG